MPKQVVDTGMSWRSQRHKVKVMADQAELELRGLS